MNLKMGENHEIKTIYCRSRFLTKKNPHEVLHKKLKELFSAIEIYEKSDYSKRNEFNKLDTFKDFIKHFARDMERGSGVM